MTMQSYFWSGTGGHDIDALPEVIRNRPRCLLAVVVAHEHAVPLGHPPPAALGTHLETQLQARALELHRPHVGPYLLVEEGRGPVVDVALGEDPPESVVRRGPAVRHPRAHVVDARRLEEAQELDVVQVLHRVEIAEANPLHHREALVAAHSGGSGICMRAMAFTRNQNSALAAAITSNVTITAARLLAISSRMLNRTMANARSACSVRTAQ